MLANPYARLPCASGTRVEIFSSLIDCQPTTAAADNWMSTSERRRFIGSYQEFPSNL
jgi:hypothetical protein